MKGNQAAGVILALLLLPVCLPAQDMEKEQGWSFPWKFSLHTLSVSAERHGDAVLLSCSDSDAALRGLLGSFPGARDIEVRGGSLEEAFLELTAGAETVGASTGGEAR